MDAGNVTQVAFFFVKDEKIQDRLVHFWNGYGIEDFFNAPVVNRKFSIDRTIGSFWSDVKDLRGKGPSTYLGRWYRPPFRRLCIGWYQWYRLIGVCSRFDTT